jgi:hypothetical protein
VLRHVQEERERIRDHQGLLQYRSELNRVENAFRRKGGAK